MTNQAAHIIDIRNLSRHFGNKAALQDVTLQIPRGKALGSNGSPYYGFWEQ